MAVSRTSHRLPSLQPMGLRLGGGNPTQSAELGTCHRRRPQQRIADDMIKKALLGLISLVAVLAAAGYVTYVTNTAPTVPAISAAEAAKTNKPYVVKLHAQWCPKCMMTKDIWSQIEAAYAARVNLLVLDFTSEANTEASRAEAERLGLERFFDEYGGVTGTIVVLDGRTKEVTASIDGSRDFADYRAAIDAILDRRG
jgi:thiol-disulfide isomerase/thioredoxin